MNRELAMSDRLARALAFAVPAVLLAGAYVSQYGFGLAPCEMCWWQRYPHFIAIGLALLSTFAAPRKAWIALAGLAIFVSGAIGVFHAGVEYDWWEGLTHCAMGPGGGDAFSLDSLELDLVRCDEAAWTLGGVSLAGWNALISIGSALAIWLLLAVRPSESREKRA